MRTARALVILGFSLSLVACGGSGPSSPPESATPTASSSRETPLSPTAQAHSNLLYVIDSADGSTGGNQILVIDPVAKAVVRTIESDYTPDAALSPDGHFLYLASAHPYRGADTLAIIDTSTGAAVGKPIDIRGR